MDVGLSYIDGCDLANLKLPLCQAKIEPGVLELLLRYSNRILLTQEL